MRHSLDYPCRPMPVADIEAVERFQAYCQWCDSSGYIRLTEWLKRHNAATQDLHVSGLITYYENEPRVIISGCTYGAFLTPARSMVIGTADIRFSQQQIVHLDLTFSHVTDSDLLLELLQPHLNKSPVERRRDYVREYKAIHNCLPAPTEEEKPFERKAFIAGPYCDLHKLHHIPAAYRKNSCCAWCGDVIEKSVPFIFEDKHLCQNCAAIVYSILIPLAREHNELSLKQYRESIKNLADWKKRYVQHIAIKPFRVALTERFTGNKQSYIDAFINENPKPEIIPYFSVGPALSFHSRPRYKPYAKKGKSTGARHCQVCGCISQLHEFRLFPASLEEHDAIGDKITICSRCLVEKSSVYLFDEDDDEMCHPDDPVWPWLIPFPLELRSIEELRADPSLFEPGIVSDPLW